MKNLFQLPIAMMFSIVLVSCSTDSQDIKPVKQKVRPQVPQEFNYDEEEFNEVPSNIYFGFLEGRGNSDTYLEMPIESSTIHFFVGRWKIVKMGVDAFNNGNVEYYYYKEYPNKDCELSFLQFNNDGFVFENSYYKAENVCTLFTVMDYWQLIEANRFKIYNYNNIYLVKANESELILKYDWSVESSIFSPMQLYYHYERIPPGY